MYLVHLRDRGLGMTSHRRAVNGALEMGLVIAWSSGFIGARLAADTTSIYQVLFWRFALVTLVLAPFVVLQVRKGVTARDVAIQALLGVLAMFAYLALGVKSIALGVPTGTAALISALQPLMTAALAGPLLGELVRSRQWTGLALGFCGVVLAVSGEAGRAPTLAYGLSFGATVALVVATLIAKALNSAVSLVAGLGIQSAVTALLFAPLAVGDGGLIPTVTGQFAAAVAWFIVFSTLIGYGLYWLCLQRSTATRIGSLIYLTPPVTMIWGWAMFGEPLHPVAVGALALCAAGVYLARQPQPASASPSSAT